MDRLLVVGEEELLESPVTPGRRRTVLRADITTVAGVNLGV
jgi:hypothetical protein